MAAFNRKRVPVQYMYEPRLEKMSPVDILHKAVCRLKRLSLQLWTFFEF